MCVLGVVSAPIRRGDTLCNLSRAREVVLLLSHFAMLVPLPQGTQNATILTLVVQLCNNKISYAQAEQQRFCGGGFTPYTLQPSNMFCFGCLGL